MSFQKKFRKAVKKILGDTSGIKWRDLDHKKVYGAGAGVIAVIAAVVVLIISPWSDQKETAEQPEENLSIVAEESAVEEPVDENPLEVNAHAEVNDVVMKYFQGLSAGDIAMVEEAVDVLTEEEKLTIEKKKDYIEAYNGVTCYTKKGLEENTYVVFAAYEQKFYNIETSAPGIMAFYVFEAEDGTYRIFNGEASEELTSYVLELAAEEEVAAIIADVDSRYQQLVAEDEDFGKFAQTMLESQQEQPETEEPEAPAESETVAELETPVKTKVTDGIRVRAERSTDSQIRATITTGTEVEVYASYSDGWSKIKYLTNEGYCKTEYLESTEGVPMITENAESTEESEEPQEEETTPAQENADVTAVNKEMTFTATVRIRADRTTDSAQIGSGYEGAKVKVVESYSDGWSKLSFEGKTGYCKTEYLQ